MSDLSLTLSAVTDTNYHCCKAAFLLSPAALTGSDSSEALLNTTTGAATGSIEYLLYNLTAGSWDRRNDSITPEGTRSVSVCAGFPTGQVISFSFTTRDIVRKQLLNVRLSMKEPRV